MSENVTEKDLTLELFGDKCEGMTIKFNPETQVVRVEVEDHAENIAEEVNKLYDAVKAYNEANEDKVIIMVDIRDCSVIKKAEVIRAALKREDLEDPLMLLNIFNLVKVYNTLDDKYFASPDIFLHSVEELLDLKLMLSNDLKQFSRMLSIYFLSIIKSYNKMTFTPADEHIALPKAFEAIILSSDLLTLSSIFAKASNISTDDLVYVDNAYIYMTSLINKGIDCANMLGEFLDEHEVQ